MSTNFTLRTPSHIKSCHVTGSWDSYKKRYEMTTEPGMGPGYWSLNLNFASLPTSRYFYYVCTPPTSHPEYPTNFPQSSSSTAISSPTIPTTRQSSSQPENSPSTFSTTVSRRPPRPQGARALRAPHLPPPPPPPPSDPAAFTISHRRSIPPSLITSPPSDPKPILSNPSPETPWPPTSSLSTLPTTEAVQSALRHPTAADLHVPRTAPVAQAPPRQSTRATRRSTTTRQLLARKTASAITESAELHTAKRW